MAVYREIKLAKQRANIPMGTPGVPSNIRYKFPSAYKERQKTPLEENLDALLVGWRQLLQECPEQFLRQAAKSLSYFTACIKDEKQSDACLYFLAEIFNQLPDDSPMLIIVAKMAFSIATVCGSQQHKTSWELILETVQAATGE